MGKHEIIACNRCRSRFECKVGTVLQCGCMEVPLSEEERIFIREQFQGCLCPECMWAMKKTYHSQRVKRLLNRLSGSAGAKS